MRPACLRWPLPPAIRMPTRGHSSTSSPTAAFESLNAVESRAPRCRRPWLHRPWRRPSTQPPPHCLRLLPLSQLSKPSTRRLNSRHPAFRRHRPRRFWLQLIQLCLPHPFEASCGEAPSSSAPSTKGKGGAAQPFGGPPGNSDDDPDKKKRDNEIDTKRKGQFLIDSAALKSTKVRARKNMKCEVDRIERGTDIPIKN